MRKKRITTAGTFRLGAHPVYVSSLLAHDSVCLEEVHDGVWNHYSYDLLLGRNDEREGVLRT